MAAYAATVRSLIAVITTLNEQVRALQGQVEDNFGAPPIDLKARPRRDRSNGTYALNAPP